MRSRERGELGNDGVGGRPARVESPPPEAKGKIERRIRDHRLWLDPAFREWDSLRSEPRLPRGLGEVGRHPGSPRLPLVPRPYEIVERRAEIEKASGRRFRHEKVMDFFLVHAFLGTDNPRPQQAPRRPPLPRRVLHAHHAASAAAASIYPNCPSTRFSDCPAGTCRR